MPETFHCSDYNLKIPAESQRSFCAVQFRKERIICIDCETGRKAAKEERDMPAVKKCVDCGKEYQATSNVQKRCADCKDKHKASGGGQKKVQKQKPAKKAEKKAPALQEPTEHYESVQVINILVSAGIITQGQLDATRRLVNELHS